MRKKVLAKHWVEENSTEKEKLDPGEIQKEEQADKRTAATTPPPPPTQKSPTPPPPQEQKTPTSANHILKNRLTQAPLPVE